MSLNNQLIKFWIWTGLMTIFTLVFWHYCEELYVQATLNVTTGPWSILAFILAMTLVAVGMMIFKELKRSSILVLVFPLTYLYVFGLQPEITISALIFVALGFASWNMVRKDMKDSLRIHASRTSRLALRPILVGLALMVSVASISSLSVQDLVEAPAATQEQITELVERFGPEEYEGLPGDQQESVIIELTRRVNGAISSLLDSSSKYLPQAFAISLFVVLLGLSWIAVFAIGLVCGALFYILRRAGFINIEKIQTEAERVIV